MKVIITGSEGFIGRALSQALTKRGIEVIGIDRKITQEEFDRIVGGLPRKRTNQEERDALLLAWSFAELPIRI